MKLREEEFYNQYHQHGGTTIIPTEIFNELYDDATEEIERLNNIIGKALNYLEENKKESNLQLKGTPTMYVFNGRIFDLLKILRGEDGE